MFEYIGGVPTEIWFDNTRNGLSIRMLYGGKNMAYESEEEDEGGQG